MSLSPKEMGEAIIRNLPQKNREIPHRAKRGAFREKGTHRLAEGKTQLGTWPGSGGCAAHGEWGSREFFIRFALCREAYEAG